MKKTESLIDSVFKVYNIIGYCFLEKTYQRAVQAKLKQQGYSAELK
ncbi:hypothetical protein HQ585_02830 [candidate division KSB1 bacterium]|nr:hypothetical protein [candidate division KSB1 bacterium]